MPELTPERLAELREMHQKATPGPVTLREYAENMIGVGFPGGTLADFSTWRTGCPGTHAEAKANAEEFAALRNSASALFDLAQEALERREAEKCQECEGLGILHYGSPPEQKCGQCNGTGKNSPADELLRALRRLMAWSVGENALTKHSDVMDQARAAISRYEEKR